MNIINHGSWALYTPDQTTKDRQEAPSSALFCKRTSDDTDWYDYIYFNGSPFAPGSIKITIYAGEVMAATRDESMLFPQRMTLLEVTGDAVEDPQEAYGGFIYDAEANTLSAPAPAPVTVEPVSPRQARLALLAAGLLDEVQAAVDAAGGATKITWEYATEISRTDPMIDAIGAALNMTDAQIDALFATAKTL